jgi:hypothetical protein
MRLEQETTKTNSTEKTEQQKYENLGTDTHHE